MPVFYKQRMSLMEKHIDRQDPVCSLKWHSPDTSFSTLMRKRPKRCRTQLKSSFSTEHYSWPQGKVVTWSLCQTPRYLFQMGGSTVSPSNHQISSLSVILKCYGKTAWAVKWKISLSQRNFNPCPTCSNLTFFIHDADSHLKWNGIHCSSWNCAPKADTMQLWPQALCLLSDRKQQMQWRNRQHQKMGHSEKWSSWLCSSSTGQRGAGTPEGTCSAKGQSVQHFWHGQWSSSEVTFLYTPRLGAPS